MRDRDAMIGRELDGRYTIRERIGRGAMGTVYRGRQHSVERDVAIKLIAPHLATEEMVVKRFLREARLASSLQHPNVVSVLDFGQTPDNVFYLVMELVTGRTLDQVVVDEFPLALERIVKIGVQVCDALDGAHELGIIHRDLKPQNVMIAKRDLVKVLDFGLAKSLSGPRTSMTHANATLGTPAFMPPEFFARLPIDTRSDLYALGCVLYVAATGRLPFPVNTLEALIQVHERGELPDVTRIPQLAPVITRLLAKSPARRFQTAMEARAALEHAPHVPVGAAVLQQAERRRTAIGWAPALSHELAELAGLDIPADDEPTSLRSVVPPNHGDDQTSATELDFEVPRPPDD